MMMNRRAWMQRGVGAAILSACVCGGCASSENKGPALRPVTLADFVEPASTQPAASGPAANETVVAAAGATRDNAGAASRPGPSSQPGPSTAPVAARPPARVLKPGEPVIVDSLIGQVSGRPIFADALLEPIADQLQKVSEQSNPREFVQRAKFIVDNRLREVVLNNLFLAESEASLTTQQQQGLLAFLRNARERTIAESLGIVAQREQELQEQGVTLDQFIAMRKDEVLISTLLSQKIEPRVIVSWKDVQREYERRKAEFNPPAVVTLQRIRLSNPSQPDLVEQVKNRLAAGESFESVGLSLDSAAFKTLDPIQMKSDDVSDIEINDAYKPFLKDLKQGQTTQPIVIKDRASDDTVWLHVLKIDQPPQRTIYEVQRQLISELERRRRDEQRQKYAKSLFEKGIYDQLDQMSQRILTVAILRYGR